MKLNEAIALWEQVDPLSLSKWADAFAYLSPESAHEPGRWKTLPYQKEIMDAFTDPTVEKITVKKSARVGYTKILNNIIGYSIHHDPRSVLVVQPTVEDAQGYSKDEIAPMLRDTPVLQGLVSEAKTRDSSNTILKKTYPGGSLMLIGANSPRGFRRISVPIVLFDEVNGYPVSAGSEGDQIKLGTKRSEWYWNRKIVIGSTPSIKGMSKVTVSFEESDKRYYHVPCPHCNEFQSLMFGGEDADFGIKWPKGMPEKAYYLCRKCHQPIAHSQKRWMVENGIWVPTAEFNGHAGFFIWAAYSYAPNAKWSDIAIDFLQSKDDPELLKTHVNTWQGEDFEEQGDQPEWTVLKARCEPYEPMTVPMQAKMLTSGTDVQHNRLAVSVFGWGPGEESWLIYHIEIIGDPMHPDVWEQHDQLIYRPWKHASGVDLRICSAGVDAADGNTTQAVRNYCRFRGPVVFALIGQAQPNKPIIGIPTKQDVTWEGQRIDGGVEIWPVGSSTGKSTIYNRLNINELGPGRIHHYIGLDDEYFHQLTAEKIVTRFVKGYPVREWHNVRGNRRNESLDTAVYAYAAAIRAGVSYANFNTMLTGQPKSRPKPRPEPKKQSGWLSGAGFGVNKGFL